MKIFENLDRERLLAAAKMAGGVARMAGAVVTGTGHGVIGTALKNHRMMGLAARLAKHSFEGGRQMFQAGLDEWNDATTPKPKRSTDDRKPVA